MLASTTETPRPRPPGKVRRASAAIKAASATSTPPPAYGSTISFPTSGQPQRRLDTLLGSPMSATFQMVGWDLSNRIEVDPSHQIKRDLLLTPAKEDMNWVNEKSREELAGLLFKADDIIRERGNELDHTSAFCKSLYEDNVALKTKHQALLARLDGSLSDSASSPELSASPLFQSNADIFGPSSINRSRSRANSESAIRSSVSPPSPGSFTRHVVRRVSVSAAEISVLVDQNAELLEKIEKLEEEATSSDQAGRRELKRLEKDIAFLREELEKTQAKSEEMEERAKAGFGLGAERVVEEVWKRKKAREAKFKAMRGLRRGAEEPEKARVPSFAPGSFSLFAGGPDTTRSESLSPDLGTLLHLQNQPQPEESVSPIVSGDGAGAPRPSEHSLIAQLLVKIQELEKANEQIIDQQVKTADRLETVQRETEHMTKVYETLAETNAVDLQFDLDGVGEKGEYSTPSADKTIKLQSIKGRHLTTTLNTHGTPARNRSISGPSKVPNNNVIGLFDESSLSIVRSISDDPSTPFNLSLPLPNSPWSSGHFQQPWPGSNRGISSPALSCISIFSSPSPGHRDLLSHADGSHQTLDSELRMEFGDNWNLSGGSSSRPHHLRGTSLYDFTMFESPKTPSPTSRMSISHGRTLGEDAESPQRDMFLLDGEESLMPGSLVDRNVLRFSVEPPTPKKVDQFENFKSPRHEKMSQTLSLRKGRWVAERFGERPQSRDGKERTSSVSHRIANAVDSMVDSFTSHDSIQAHSRDASESPEGVKTVQLRAHQKPSTTQKFGSVLIEIWLWLQFGIIILVFLWAIARKGPKSVLIDAEQRKNAVLRR